MANKGTELTIPKAVDITELSEFSTIQSMGEAFFKSGMFSDVKSAAQAIVKIAAGMELCLPPVYSMQNINLIRNRLTASANTLALMVKRSGRYNYRIKVHTDQECKITFYEKEFDKWVDIGDSTFTMEDAKRAELLKPDSGWQKYPRAMLFSRAISQGARMYAPDAIGGIYTDEEIRSIPPKPDETVESEVIISTKEAKDTAQDKPPAESASAPAVEKVDTVKDKPKFKDGGELVAYAQKEKKLSLEKIYATLNIKSPSEIKDIEVAAKVLLGG